MSYEFKNDTPIYLQIIELIKMQIISKKYLPNDKIPSVRELSVQFSVNPNTIQKALTELEDIGLIYTERTNGKFVTYDVKIIKKVTERTIRERVQGFYNSMEQLGFSKEEVLEIIKEKL